MGEMRPKHLIITFMLYGVRIVCCTRCTLVWRDPDTRPEGPIGTWEHADPAGMVR